MILFPCLILIIIGMALSYSRISFRSNLSILRNIKTPRFSTLRSNIDETEIIHTTEHDYFMKLAIRHAQFSFRDKEVPVGAVIVDENNRVVSASRNKVELLQDATMHAEIDCIKKASFIKKNWRLNNCTLYTTLEPCPMCMGAIKAARIKRVIYGAPAINTDMMTHTISLDNTSTTEVIGGILKEECVTLLKRFFQQRRQSDKYETSTTNTSGSISDGDSKSVNNESKIAFDKVWELQ